MMDDDVSLNNFPMQTAGQNYVVNPDWKHNHSLFSFS